MPIINNVRELSDRITFVDIQGEVDDYGQVVEEEVEVFSCWASVRSQMLKDLRTTIGTVLEGTITMIIRYEQPNSINTKMKIKYKDKVYSIIAINEGTAFKDYTTIVSKLE